MVLALFREVDIERVHLAILKLSSGALEGLGGLVEMARRDYRDVLAYAQYPKKMRLGFVARAKKTPEEASEIQCRDKKQYQRWLEE